MCNTLNFYKSLIILTLALVTSKASASDPYIEFFNAPSTDYRDKLNSESFSCYSTVESHEQLRQFIKNCSSQSDIDFDFELTQLSASLSDDSALCLLARVFKGDFGGGVRSVDSFKLFHSAASKGNINAIYYLGESYEQGFGTDLNNLKAYVYLSMSTLRGSVVNPQNLNNRLAVLSSKLSESELSIAQAAQAKLYWGLRQTDAMRFPSQFSITTPSADFLTRYC